MSDLFAWLPIVLVFATVIILSNFFFAMLALAIVLPVVFALLVALAGAIVAAPFLISRSALRDVRERRGARQRTAALALAKRHDA